MTRTYSALLRGDRLEWTGETPAAGDLDRPVPVQVVIDEPAARRTRRSAGRRPSRPSSGSANEGRSPP